MKLRYFTVGKLNTFLTIFPMDIFNEISPMKIDTIYNRIDWC